MSFFFYILASKMRNFPPLIPLRMLLSFASKIASESTNEKLTDQQLMELMMSHYEAEVANPVKSLIWGELATAMLIQVSGSFQFLYIFSTFLMVFCFSSFLPNFGFQVQKLKLDIET